MQKVTGYLPELTEDRAAAELQDWLAAFDESVQIHGRAWGERILRNLQMYAQSVGVNIPLTSVTPYANTIPAALQPPYPGDLEMEQRITALVRWNAMVMVHRANTHHHGLGGHIATFASSAQLYEVGQQHFFRGANHPDGPDFIHFQGHASPGMYARGYLEGRFDEEQIKHFRRETGDVPGLSSYPHPWLMPNYWQVPTVSMGLNGISGIYHARFLRYMEDRGLKQPNGQKIWCFLGDGETDEPESLGAINLASREKLDNLIFVINCNLQRLDGPVRGNGKIIQELEGTFRGSGWRVIKVIWGSDWDPLFARDPDNLIIKRASEIVDGEFQKYSVEPGWYMRERFFGANPQLLDLVKQFSDEELRRLRRGGHDPLKIHAAYRAAMQTDGRPTVILVKTIKGYGMDEGGEGLNIAHNAKIMPYEALRHFRDRFDLPIPDEQLDDPPFYKPHEKSAEIRYLQDRRRSLGGYLPSRKVNFPVPEAVAPDVFSEFHNDSDGREASTTMVFVRMLSKMLKDKSMGRFLVPIVPDESRTFGLDALFRQCGIYSHVGQLYEPVDSHNVLYYKEAREGQILEEGITEAGSMASFLAVGTAYANHGVPTVPIYMFYSMFGLQRTGDQVWQAADARARGFLIGCTAGRTTLNGEGLQHQDGHSHLLAQPVPNLKAYDPAWSYEVAVIVEEGMRRLIQENEDWIYYITVGNENYEHPQMPDRDIREGILRGLYLFRPAENPDAGRRLQLFGSGPLLKDALAAQAMLAEKWNVQADVWSVTSYKELRTEALDCDHWNMRHPQETPRVSYLSQTVADAPGPFVAVSDYMKLLPDSIAQWLPRPLVSLGTDGFGRSDSREALRAHFEVDTNHIVFAALRALQSHNEADAQEVAEACKTLEIDPEKINPLLA